MAFLRRQMIAPNYTKETQASDYSTVRKHRPDYQIILYMGLLLLLGLVIMYAIGPQRANVLNNAYGSSYSSTYFFVKQLVSIGLALVVFVAMTLIPYSFIAKHAGKAVIFGLAACLFLAIAGLLDLGIAQETLGATRWFNFGSFGSLQPSEILKFGILIYMAGFLGAKIKQGTQNDINETLIPIGILSVAALFLIVVVQKDLGTGVSLIGIISSMLLIGKINMKNGIIIGLIILAMGLVFVFSAGHRIDRVMTFLQGDNTSSSDGDSYHIEQARLAIGSGGLFGVGVGNSVQSTGYLPEATNDSVFAIMGETFGFVGLVTILMLFRALLMRLLRQIDHQTDIRVKLIIAGTFGWLGSHVILNVASMIGLIPLTGITLPLLSFGGTSLMFIAAALGLVFQFSYYSVHFVNYKEASHENFGSRRGIGRSRYAGRSSSTRN